MTRRPPAPLSLTTILLIGLGMMVLLGGFVWLALAYNHTAMIAVLLPVLPVAFSFLIEQCQKSLDLMDEDDEEGEG